MIFFLAILPILVIVSCMLFLKWGSEKAVPAGLLVGLIISWWKFGLNWQVLGVAEGKGIFIALNVLLILWSALFLFKLVDINGGTQAISDLLESMSADKGWLAVVMAWCLTGAIEGLAGFGLPMAIVGALLIGIGVSPITAVAAAAIGNGWSVSYGSMASVFEILSSVTGVNPQIFAPYTGLLLSFVIFLSGFGLAAVLGQLKHWRRILGLGLLMAVVQGVLTRVGVYILAGFIASLVGIAAGILVSRKAAPQPLSLRKQKSLQIAIRGYGVLTVIAIIFSLIQPLRRWVGKVTFNVQFPAVKTNLGLVTPAASSYTFHIFLHTAFYILATVVIVFLLFRQGEHTRAELFSIAWQQSLKSAKHATIGIIAMVALSVVMEHTGMSLVIANGLITFTGGGFPLVSPLIGVIGTFATGSNSNSNVLFGALQNDIARTVGLNQGLILGAQNAGGSLGSMIAPAKLVVGTSNTGLEGRDGEVLRVTLLYGLGIAVILGVVVLVLSLLGI